MSGLTEEGRLAALALVAEILTNLGDDSPAALVDVHRILATGATDKERGEGQTPPPADVSRARA
jgi:deoxycytidylate deaminase